MGESNKTQWFVIGGLFLALLAGVVASGSSSSSKEKEKKAAAASAPALAKARAVLLPAGDGIGRTVVVPPCGTAGSTISRDIRSGEITSGALQLRGGGGDAARAVLVPDCHPDSGGVTADGEQRAAAFVLPIGAKAAKSDELKVAVQGQIVVPRGSPVRTLVVTHCSQRGAKREDIVVTPRGDDDTLFVPGC